MLVSSLWLLGQRPARVDSAEASFPSFLRTSFCGARCVQLETCMNKRHVGLLATECAEGPRAVTQRALRRNLTDELH